MVFCTLCVSYALNVKYECQISFEYSFLFPFLKAFAKILVSSTLSISVHVVLKFLSSLHGIFSFYFSLLMTKCKLEEVVFGLEESLSTCKHILVLWKEIYESVLEK